MFNSLAEYQGGVDNLLLLCGEGGAFLHLEFIDQGQAFKWQAREQGCVDENHFVLLSLHGSNTVKDACVPAHISVQSEASIRLVD